MQKKLMVGGQAVIEGVMMKSAGWIVTAVRKPNNKIAVKKEKHISITKKMPVLGIPLLRGAVVLFETLVIGIRTLSYSAQEAFEEGEEELSKSALFFTLLFSLAFAVGLFVLLPYALTYLLGFSEQKHAVLFNLVDGIIKLGIFLAYLLLIGRMQDVQRVFQYHGAEHKAVSCFEAGKTLEVKNAKGYSTAHPRCGTTFLLLVMFISILLFSLVPWLVNLVYPNLSLLHPILQKLIFFLTRIVFIFHVAGLSYELLKLGGEHQDKLFFRILAWPGMMVQKLTTKEPDKKQLEVGLVALRELLKLEKVK